MNSEHAKQIATSALIWLSSNEELLPIFLGASGACAQDLRAQVGDDTFLASVLEFITMDDAWVIEFCDSEGLKYEQPLRARYSLTSAENVYWT